MKLKKKHTVEDLFEVASGSTPSTSVESYWSSNGNGIKWITPKDLSRLENSSIFTTERKITLEGLNSCSARLIPKESIILSSRAPIGYVAVLKDEMSCNQGCKALIPKKPKEVDPLYFYYLFLTKEKELNNLGSGSTFKELSKTKLEEFSIAVHDIKDQQEIAQVLEQVDKARQQRKAANALTYHFLQSSFLSLFGDPVKNEKGWEVKSFSKLAHIEKEAIQSENIGNKNNYVGLEHIEKDTGRLLAYQHTSEIDLKSTKFSFTREHILYGKLRPYLNKVCLPGIDGVCSTDILPIKAIRGVSDKYFIAYLMKQPFFIEKATSMSNGANLPRISPKTLETFDVIIPPLSLQQQFAGIVTQAEQLRQKQKESERELENLFQGLLQRYFG